MATSIYDVDPDGDVILTLKVSTEPFAVWKDKQEDITPENPSESAGEALETEVETEIRASWPSDSSSQSPDISQTALEGAKKETSIEFRLSSKHLILASGYFKRALTSSWREQTIENGMRTITASEWDEESFKVLMNIIHGRHENVPRTVQPEMLTKMAVLTEYYQCFEVMDIWFRDIWIPKLKDWNPKEYGRDLVMRLYIAWVLREHSVFVDLTRIAVLQARGTMQTLELPIPSQIVEQIEKRRLDTMKTMIDCLHDLSSTYLKGDVCSYECTSMHLGAIMKFIETQHLPSAEEWRCLREDMSFEYSVSELKAALINIQQPHWPSPTYGYNGHNCQSRFASLLNPVILKLEDDVGGINIIDTKKQKRDRR